MMACLTFGSAAELPDCEIFKERELPLEVGRVVVEPEPPEEKSSSSEPSRD